jgi:hypothetical protein
VTAGRPPQHLAQLQRQGLAEVRQIGLGVWRAGGRRLRRRNRADDRHRSQRLEDAHLPGRDADQELLALSLDDHHPLLEPDRQAGTHAQHFAAGDSPGAQTLHAPRQPRQAEDHDHHRG